MFHLLLEHITKGFHTKGVHYKVPDFILNGYTTKYRIYTKGVHYKVPDFILKGYITKYQVFIPKGVHYKVSGSH